MALRGNLKDFSLPDVFQLVTFSRKTGVLRINRDDGAVGSVWFRDGDVFFAQSNWHAELLGERLVRAQRVTGQALSKALQIRESEGAEGRRLGTILVDEGYITQKVLETFVQEQIQDTIFDLMRWDEGDFDFEAMPELVDEDIGLTVSIENVVMEGSRRLEEWNRIKKKIPSTEVVFKMATAPGEGTFEISLKPIEWQALLLTDATRSVADLAVETGRTDFEVARILYGLFSAGLLEFATDEEIEHHRAERSAREEKLREIEAERSAAEAVRLAEEAEAAAAAQPEPVEAAAEIAEPSTPVEDPSFLGGGVVAPSEEDEAVLEAFMGAVLEQPAPDSVQAPPPEEAAPSVPYVPAEEPAFMGVESEEETGLPVPSVEDLMSDITITPPPEPEPVAVVEAPPDVLEQPPAGLAPAIELRPSAEDAEVAALEPVVDAPPVPESAPTLEPEPVVESDMHAPAPPISDTELAEEPAIELEIAPDSGFSAEIELELEPAGQEPVESVRAEVVETPDFEHDLMSLGLGELPADLMGPVTEMAPEPPAVSEPMSVVGSAESPSAGAEVPEGRESSAEGALSPDEITQLQASLELPAEAEIVELEEEIAEEPDFSDLLHSLDVDGPAEQTSADAVGTGFDEELLRDSGGEGAGVISTDAYLEDIAIDELGMTGSLNDELSALTGLSRPSRPKASVNKIPEAGASQLHRDTRVDKDTLLKIIDGIKNL